MVCSVSYMEPEKKREHGREIGKTGATVAANIKRLREDQFSLRELETKLEGLGVKISASGLQKIEAGTRRVDVDELMALAVALNVNPNVLLFPQDDSCDDVSDKVTAMNGEVSGDEIWDWANTFRVLGSQSPIRMLNIPGSDKGPLARAYDISGIANAALFDTEMMRPPLDDEGEEQQRLVFQAYYHSKNLQQDEILSLWHIDAKGNAAEVAGIPHSPEFPQFWFPRIKKTIVGIATRSIEASLAKDDVLRALKESPNGDD